MLNTTNFASAGVGTILKRYLNLTNSDILKEKSSYYLTYGNDKTYKPEHIDDYRLELNPRISIYRYLCELVDKPALTLQSALDSYIKTFEVISTSSSGNTQEPVMSIEASQSSENWGRRFLTHLEQTTPFGLRIEILEDTKFQKPDNKYNIDYFRKSWGSTDQPVFGFMLFRVTNTSTDFGYSWQQRRALLQGPGANSPFSNHDGTYLVLSFPHPRPEEHNHRRYHNNREQYGDKSSWNSEHRGYAEDKRRPFYASHVCFKVKPKHTYYGSDLDKPDLACPMYPNVNYNYTRYSEEHLVGTSRLDIYATTPLDYDATVNNQTELLNTRGQLIGAPDYTWGGSGTYHHKRRTFIRWSAYTDNLDDLGKKLSWKFSGRYYDGDSKFLEHSKDVPNLEVFEITKDERYLGKGKLFADADKILHCPLTGFPLRCCSYVGNTYKRIEEYQSSRTDWY